MAKKKNQKKKQAKAEDGAKVDAQDDNQTEQIASEQPDQAEDIQDQDTKSDATEAETDGVKEAADDNTDGPEAESETAEETAPASPPANLFSLSDEDDEDDEDDGPVETTDTLSKNADKDTVEVVKDIEDVKDVKDVKAVKDVKDAKDIEDVEDVKDSKDSKDTKDATDATDAKDTKDTKDKDTKDKDTKDKDTKDKDTKDTKETTSISTPKDTINSANTSASPSKLESAAEIKPAKVPKPTRKEDPKADVTVPSSDTSDSDSEMEFPKVSALPDGLSTPTRETHPGDPDMTPVPFPTKHSPHVTMDSSATFSTPTDIERVYRRRNTATSSRSRMTVKVDTSGTHQGISIDEFLEEKELTFRLVTWNVHNRAPPIIDEERLDSLFLPQSDITVLALQEADPVSGLVSTAQTLNGWKAAVLETLQKGVPTKEKDSANVTEKEVGEEEDENEDTDKEEKGENKTEETKEEKKTKESSESGTESGYESSTTDNDHAYYDPYDNYVVSSNQLIGLLIIVIARKEIMSQVSDVRVKSTGTGLLGVWGNKGAVLVEMHIGREATSTQSSKGGFFVPGTRLCFLNCHLSAGDNNVVRRRWEIDQMYRRLQLPGKPEWYAQVGDKGRRSSTEDAKRYADYNASSEFLGTSSTEDSEEESMRGPFSAATTITEMSPNIDGGRDDAASTIDGAFNWDQGATAAAGAAAAAAVHRGTNESSGSVDSESDDSRTVFFFLGDLNYRVDQTHEAAVERINKNDFSGLLANDQLLQDMKEERVLAGLNEFAIEFPPTYKYQLGTISDLETNRTPSYTDRILSRAWGGAELSQKGYHSHMEYTVSDHKPVSATFELSLPLIDFDKRATIVNEHLKSVGVQENMDRPCVTVSPMALRVKLAVLTTQTVPLMIHNTGHTPALWEITQTAGVDGDNDKKEGKETTPSITLSSSSGRLLPGDQEIVEVTFSAAIGAPSLDSFAIVHVKDSKDIFIDTGYDVLPSCFGSDLDYLSRLPNGARNGLSEDGKVVSNMPQEIWKCVDYLWSRIDDGEDSDSGSATDRSARPSVDKAARASQDKSARSSMAKDGTNGLAGLFTSPGDPHLEMDIRQWLDTGVPFDAEVLNENPLGPQSVASQLHLLLASLSQRIIPEHAYLSVPEKTSSSIPFMGSKDNTPDIAAHILEAVPNVNANVMIYLCSFIRLLVDRKAMPLKTALDVFAPLLMDSPKQNGVKVWKKSPISSAKLLQHMIDTY